MILFLFSSYHLSVSDTSAARTPTAVAAAPTGLTLFSSNLLLLLLHTLYQQQLREKRVRARRSSSSSSRTTCRSLTIQLLLQALALPPFLPSFPKTFSTPSDQSSIYVAGEHRWPDQSVEENLPVLKMPLTAATNSLTAAPNSTCDSSLPLPLSCLFKSAITAVLR